jgi:hypothetical protein
VVASSTPFLAAKVGDAAAFWLITEGVLWYKKEAVSKGWIVVLLNCFLKCNPLIK